MLAASSVAAQQRTYEEKRLEQELRRQHLTLEGQPEGKRIAFIRSVRDDVFVRGEFYPLWFNRFHWLTKESTVRRELQFAVGDAYDTTAVEESMRILRALGIFSTVRIVAVQSDDADAVGVIVQTRDLWSLRIETDFQTTGKVIDYFTVQLVERNFLGRQKVPSVLFSLVPDSYRIGQGYADRRVRNSVVQLNESSAVIFNRFSSRVEGGTAALSLRRPLYSLAERWSGGLDTSFSKQIQRRLRNGKVVPYDIPETPETETIRSVWDEWLSNASLFAAYRFGTTTKISLSGGWSYNQQWVRTNSETALQPEQSAAFARDVLPLARRQLGPFLAYELFTPRFVVFENLDTFGQSENVRSGPRLQSQVRLPLRQFGSSSSSCLLSGVLEYTLAGHDAVGQALVQGSARLEGSAVVDQSLLAGLQAASPMLWRWVRLVGRLTWQGRRRDTQQTPVSLGGDNGLRGYVSQALLVNGGNLVRANFELRSRAVEWQSIHLGGVLFFDTGSVYGSVEQLRWRYAIGLGLRLLLPQFNRTPFRGDVGVPLGDDFNVVPSFSGNQVISFSNPDSALGF